MAAATYECYRSRTILWCVPRSVSTALTKCLTAVKGTQVWFEPYAYCQVAVQEFEHRLRKRLPPDCRGNEETYRQITDFLLEASSCHFKPEFISYASVKRQLESATSPHVFVKDIGTGYKNLVGHLPVDYKHTFMIRHPLKAINSYRSSMFRFLLQQGRLAGAAKDEKSFDVERDNPHFAFVFEELYNIWTYVRENLDTDPIVIDGDDLLAKPADMLPKYCRAVGLPYDESLLRWEASVDVIKDWKLAADDLFESVGEFYGTATRSSEFLPASEMPTPDHVTCDVIRCSDRVHKYYEEMYECRLK